MSQTSRETGSMSRSKCHVDIATKKNNGKTGCLLSLNATICALICKMRFEWSVSISEGILDVTPILSTFSHVNFNGYSVVDQFLKLQADNNGNYDLYALADLLVNDLFLQQEREIAHVLSRESNEKILFAIEILRVIEGISMISIIDENPKISCEFPLLSNIGYQKPDVEYLFDVTEADPIMINVELSLVKNSLVVIYKVIFPKLMLCSKNIEFPKKCNDNSSNENDIIDLIPFIESKILSSWNNRKIFLEELKKLTAVLEYDAVDFSFVIIALRMKYNNMYTICTVEFKLSCLFPSILPLTCLHDLQNAFSTPIDTSSIKTTKSVTPDRIARELILLTSSVISQQAFGEDILNL